MGSPRVSWPWARQQKSRIRARDQGPQHALAIRIADCINKSISSGKRVKVICDDTLGLQNAVSLLFSFLLPGPAPHAASLTSGIYASLRQATSEDGQALEMIRLNSRIWSLSENRVKGGDCQVNQAEKLEYQGVWWLEWQETM